MAAGIEAEIVRDLMCCLIDLRDGGRGDRSALTMPIDLFRSTRGWMRFRKLGRDQDGRHGDCLLANERLRDAWRMEGGWAILTSASSMGRVTSTPSGTGRRRLGNGGERLPAVPTSGVYQAGFDNALDFDGISGVTISAA